MTHEDALNYLLASSCSCPLDGDDEGWDQYVIELHCNSFVVVARCLNPFETHPGDDEPFRYEIKRVDPG